MNDRVRAAIAAKNSVVAELLAVLARISELQDQWDAITAEIERAIDKRAPLILRLREVEAERLAAIKEDQDSRAPAIASKGPAT